MIEVAWFLGGYLIQLVATGALLHRMVRQKSVYGLSFDTQVCLLLSTVARCIWSFETRLVETKLAYFELLASLCVLSATIFACTRYRKSLGGSKPPFPCRWKFLVLVAIVWALIHHPTRAFLTLQVLVAFTIYLEALALIPQLRLMRRLEEIDGLTSQYVSLIAISRLVRMVFWIALFLQGERFIGLFVADVIHTILSARYVWVWYRKFRRSQLGSLAHIL